MGSVGHRLLLLALGVVLIGLVVIAQRVATVAQLVQAAWRSLPPLPSSAMVGPWATVWRSPLSGQLEGASHGITVQLCLFGTVLALATIVVHTVRNRCGAVLCGPWSPAKRVRLPQLLRIVVDSLMSVPVFRRRRHPLMPTLTLVRPPITYPVVLRNALCEHPLPTICDEDLQVVKSIEAGLVTPLTSAEVFSVPALSEREREIVRLLAENYSNAQIAAELTITVLTVKRHLSNIYGKLHVTDRRAAVAYAEHHALV